MSGATQPPPAVRADSRTWEERNQAFLHSHLQRIRRQIEQQAPASPASAPELSPQAAVEEPEADFGDPRPPALDSLVEAFGLSGFERDVLLLTAGPELDGSFAAAVASAQGAPDHLAPTFSLAFERLADPHWSALSPARPLRRWCLLEIAGDSLTRGALRVDERILHHLVGIDHLDQRLQGWLEPLQAVSRLAPSQETVAAAAASLWARASAAGEDLPLLLFAGHDRSLRRTVAASVCARLGISLHLLRGDGLPAGVIELEGLIRLCEREAILGRSALCLELDPGEEGNPQQQAPAERLMDLLRIPLIVASRERLRRGLKPAVAYDVPYPTPVEREGFWQQVLSADAIAALNGRLGQVVSQFRLDQTGMRAAAEEALGGLGVEGAEDLEASGKRLAIALWNACRRQAQPRLGSMAQHIDPVATWDDLVLPQRHLDALRQIAVHVRQQRRVYEEWGFGARSGRGLGVSALFTGTSGTGKTMAAEVLANELQLDLYRIDLSAVISKYIGETEKNLARVFEGAEDGGAILLFDEADALFGKRSEVKDSHDRYANIEVSYLLQRMEAYRGLAVLTTNRRSALDDAFLRRLRFVVEFPFPDTAARAEIWRRIYPRQTPTQGLDPKRLACLNIAGGNIRNIALGAAFRAAEAERPVTMEDVLEAARVEYLKIERPLGEAEIRGWSAGGLT